MPIKREFNLDFFKKESADMFYILGLFVADGSVRHNKRGAWFIDLQLTDKDLVFAVRDALNSNHKITRRIGKKNQNDLYRLQIGSKEMCKDLNRYGIKPNKTKKLFLPEIPLKYFGDFVRGYFDGDGCISFTTYSPKDRKNKRTIFSTRFTSGDEKFLKKLKKSLQLYVKGGFIVKKNKGHELVYSHYDTLALFNLMYNNISHCMFLERKYSKFIEIFKNKKLRV